MHHGVSIDRHVVDSNPKGGRVLNLGCHVSGCNK
jgi:hypothetical protein